MIIWKKKQIYECLQFIKGFSLFIKQCYCIALSADKILTVKTQGLKRQKKNEWCFHQYAVCGSKISRFT